MDVATAQLELREAYVHGGPGTIVSGVVWLVAGVAATYYNVSTGFVFLFFGGMLIFPITTLAIRVFFRRPPVSKGNPGGLTVVETVFPMIGGLLAAWLLLPHRPEFVFPLAAIAVGTHYFGFRTAYGDTTFWILGAIMCFVGVSAIFIRMPAQQVVPYLIAVIEIIFGLWLTRSGMSQKIESTSRDATHDHH